MADIPTSNILLCDEYNYNVVNVHNNAHSYGRFCKNFHQQSTITSPLLVAAARCCCELLRAAVSCVVQATVLLSGVAAALLVEKELQVLQECS
jgi:hypothetical protein